MNIVKKLIKNNSTDINIKDNEDMTALMWGMKLFLKFFSLNISYKITFEAIVNNQSKIASAIIAVNRTNLNLQTSKDKNNTALILGEVL